MENNQFRWTGCCCCFGRLDGRTDGRTANGSNRKVTAAEEFRGFVWIGRFSTIVVACLTAFSVSARALQLFETPLIFLHQRTVIDGVAL